MGRHTAAALGAGRRVSLFNRGCTPPYLFAAAETLIGDRGVGDLEALAHGEWDAVVDVNAYATRNATQLLDAVGHRVGHYTFVSTVSVHLPTNDAITEQSPIAPSCSPAGNG